MATWGYALTIGVVETTTGRIRCIMPGENMYPRDLHIRLGKLVLDISAHGTHAQWFYIPARLPEDMKKRLIDAHSTIDAVLRGEKYYFRLTPSGEALPEDNYSSTVCAEVKQLKNELVLTVRVSNVVAVGSDLPPWGTSAEEKAAEQQAAQEELREHQKKVMGSPGPDYEFAVKITKKARKALRSVCKELCCALDLVNPLPSKKSKK